MSEPRSHALAAWPHDMNIPIGPESLAEPASETDEMRPGLAVNPWRAFLLPNFKGSHTFRSQIWSQSARNSN